MECWSLLLLSVQCQKWQMSGDRAAVGEGCPHELNGIWINMGVNHWQQGYELTRV
jgi:hypothetical protein